MKQRAKGTLSTATATATTIIAEDVETKDIFGDVQCELPPKKFLCQICNKSFQWSNDLKKHLRIHSGERPYNCDKCGRNFRQAGALRDHIASQHGTSKAFICFYCTKSFPIKERLRLHMRIHSGEKPYKCTLCPKTFARSGQVTQHMNTHFSYKKCKCCKCSGVHVRSTPALDRSKRNWRRLARRSGGCGCENCGKIFLDANELTKHLTCLNPKNNANVKRTKYYECAECGSEFTQKSQLKVHHRIHSGERPYQCQVCNRSFGHSSVLKLHIRKHTGEKPFRCVICTEDTAFSQLPHLKTHMKTIHKMDKSYRCTSCKQFFRTKQELLNHRYECAENLVLMTKQELQFDPDAKDSCLKNELSQLRLLIAVLLKKISTKERLKQLGFEKRLIDNVLIAALKSGGQTYCTEKSLSEADKLKANIKIFLEWTVPENVISLFYRQQKSMENLLQEITNSVF